MQLLIIIFFKTKGMKTNWKSIVLYIIRIVEMLLTGGPEAHLPAIYETHHIDHCALFG